ncbi:MAG: anthranilate phosphoribosyltransferase [Methanobacterium sp.]|uniref:anthranilate phosphoribosyltransferase n=1 Tax=Methanobacterium sp. TaxID=2164 RepID=UPI003D6543D2|nr:anthranilate phosphoribosyltransferase [Methanobacterium sp.]
MINKCIKNVVAYEDLSEIESYECMMQIVSGNASDIQIASFLTSLSMKGETIEEITGFVKAMRKVCVPVSPNITKPLVDTCGTGGDKLKTFNISTISAIIAASCGVVIAKHGNRSITSKCGGADILEAIGVNIDTDARQVEKCMEETNIGFMFAPNFHPAMKHVMPVRQELGIRTVFNILGPLTSPANADIQLLGVFDPEYVEIMANVLKNLGVKRAMVVHGFDGEGNPAMDEISTIGKTKIAILDNNKIEIKYVYPEDFGIVKTDKKLIKASDNLDENKKITLDVLKCRDETETDRARLDLCLVNVSAILFVAGIVDNFKDGVKLGFKSVKSGEAVKKLREFAKCSADMNII